LADDTHMIQAAIDASKHAYMPYSGYAVGAALLAQDGTLFTGCNVENAAYPASICAERTALVKAVSIGVREFDTLVVATRNAGAPCGVCRQMLSEFAPDLRVLLVDFDGTLHSETTMRHLLPDNFKPSDLDT
jgi:cytidine deaminase